MNEAEVKVGQVWEERGTFGRKLEVVALTEKRDPWNKLWPAARLKNTDGTSRTVVVQERNLRKRFNLVRDADGPAVTR
jgi:hypothetical protein